MLVCIIWRKWRFNGRSIVHLQLRIDWLAVLFQRNVRIDGFCSHIPGQIWSKTVLVFDLTTWWGAFESRWSRFFFYLLDRQGGHCRPWWSTTGTSCGALASLSKSQHRIGCMMMQGKENEDMSMHQIKMFLKTGLLLHIKDSINILHDSNQRPGPPKGML